MTLVDSNILIDFFIDDPKWSDWSLEWLQEAAVRGPLLINEVIYAETSTRYHTIDDFEAALASAGVTTVSAPRMALFLAGKAFLRYRRAGGIRTGVLSDFFVGAHAEVERLPLLTRDARRYRHYFPAVALIAPTLHKRKGPQLALEPLNGQGIAGYVPEPELWARSLVEA